MNTTKKLTTLLLALLLPVTAMAISEDVYDFEVDGIYYKIDNNEACVTYKTHYSSPHTNTYESDYTGDVIIPVNVTYNGSTYPVTKIGDHAFYHRDSLTTIAIPGTVTSIDWDAFSYCTGLTRVTISDLAAWCNMDIQSNPLVYAQHLYLNDTEVTDLTIPDGVTAIKNERFKYCAGLTSVKIPNSVTSIGNKAFEGCTALTSVTLGNSVTTIGQYAFTNCTALTGIEIPNSVTSIGTMTFSGCTALSRATFGIYITTIGEGAFINCAALTSINLPNSVTSIGSQAFSGCTGLTSVILGKSVTSLGKDAFQNAPSIQMISCRATTPPSWEDLSMFSTNVYNHAKVLVQTGSENAYMTDPYWGQFLGIFGFDWEGSKGYDVEIDGIYYVLDDKHATATVTNFTNGSIGIWGTDYCGDIDIPESISTESGKTYTVTAIGRYAFASCSDITSITLPNTILSFGESAFINCPITTLSIPNSLETIGEACFSGSMGLTELSFPETLRSIGSQAFYLCRNLANIHIPNSLTSIGQEVFSFTAWLDNQPDGVIYAGPFAYCYKGIIPQGTADIKPGTRYIADYAFSECPTLARVYMPNSVTTIGIRSFRSCPELEYVELPDSLITVGFQAFSGSAKIQSFDFPSTLKSVGISAFSGTAWYDNQPDGLVYTGTVAYHYKGRIPDYTDFVIPDGTVSLGDGLFSEDELFSPTDDYGELYSVIIPNSVRYIGDYVFLDCYPNLSRIIIGSGVEEMGKCSLAWIFNLTEVNISEGVKLIGEQMFSGCSNLKEITIPNSVEVIKYRAFAAEEYNGQVDDYPCESLAKVSIGSGVKSIEQFAFSGCQSLTEITCLATTPPVLEDENCFDDECYNNATLFVPVVALDAYKNAPIWQNFNNIRSICTNPGDVNGDGEVNIGDANSVIDIVVMGGNSGHTRIPEADVNGDGEINIADVNAIIEMIINNN